MLHTLLSFIVSANEYVLCKLLGFVTGCKFATAALRPGCVNVTGEETPNIFASTCTMELKLPLHFSGSAQFDLCLKAVLDSSSFNTVWEFFVINHYLDSSFIDTIVASLYLNEMSSCLLLFKNARGTVLPYFTLWILLIAYVSKEKGAKFSSPWRLKKSRLISIISYLMNACLANSGCVSICCFLLKWVLNLGYSSTSLIIFCIMQISVIFWLKVGVSETGFNIKKEIFYNYPAFWTLLDWVYSILLWQEHICVLCFQKISIQSPQRVLLWFDPHPSGKSCLASYFSFNPLPPPPPPPPFCVRPKYTKTVQHFSQQDAFRIWTHDIELFTYGTCKYNGYM